MLKLESVGLDRFQVEPFKRAVRTKRDVIAIWMYAVKAFLIGGDFVAPEDRAGSLTIATSAMSRLFCESELGKKSFSIGFPFKQKEENGELVFRSRGNYILNSKTTSDILALLGDNSALDRPDFYTFVDAIEEITTDEENIWGLLRDLMLAEDGYIRYDWDTVRVDGSKHPEHHFDVCYSSEATYKVGLKAALTQEVFIDLLDLETDCHFLTHMRDRR